MFGPKEKGGLVVGVSLFADFLAFVPNSLIVYWIPVYLVLHGLIVILILRWDLFYRQWTPARFSFIFAVVPLCFAFVFVIGSVFAPSLRTDLQLLGLGALAVFGVIVALNRKLHARHITPPRNLR